MRSSILLVAAAAAASVSAATFKCNKDTAVDYAKIIAQMYPKEIEAAKSEWEQSISIDIWNLVDEIDGKKGGIKKQSGDLLCKITYLSSHPELR